MVDHTALPMPWSWTHDTHALHCAPRHPCDVKDHLNPSQIQGYCGSETAVFWLHGWSFSPPVETRWCNCGKPRLPTFYHSFLAFKNKTSIPLESTVLGCWVSKLTLKFLAWVSFSKMLNEFWFGIGISFPIFWNAHKHTSATLNYMYVKWLRRHQPVENKDTY